MDLAEFWQFVEKSENCWIWVGKTDRDGYGRYYGRGVNEIASRVSYELHNGQIPIGAHICHICDNPSCVRPDHLYAGDRVSNMRDKAERGRARNQHSDVTECKHGHSFDAANTIVKADGRRMCRTCHNTRRRR